MLNLLKQSIKGVTDEAKKKGEELASNAKSKLQDKAHQQLDEVMTYIEKNSEKIKVEVEKSVGEYSYNGFRNNATKALIALAIYAVLPPPVKWLINEDDFNSFFMNNSESVFKALGFI